jgi:hypothetical protein
MYILLKLMSLTVDKITDFDTLKEALEEHGCGYYKLDKDHYMITASNLPALARLGDMMEHCRGMIAKVDQFIM